MYHFELLIFDLDGTLIDSKQDIANAVNLTFVDLGLPEKTHELIYSYVGNGVRQLIIDAVGSDETELVDRALDIFEKHYLAHLLDETQLFSGMNKVLNHFSQVKKAMVTNKPTHYMDKIVAGLKLAAHFDFILGGSPQIQLKPHPEMLLKTLAVLDIEPQKAVMIGDSLNDLDAARAAGVATCAVSYGFGNAETLKAANPDFIAETSTDLMGLFR